jgi:hypothetical protein
VLSSPQRSIITDGPRVDVIGDVWVMTTTCLDILANVCVEKETYMGNDASLVYTSSC